MVRRTVLVVGPGGSGVWSAVVGTAQWPSRAAGSSRCLSSGAVGRWFAVAGVSGVVGGDERPLPSARHEGVAEAGLQVMVKRTEPVEFVQPGVVRIGPGLAVVPLQPIAVAALHRASRVRPQQRGLLRGRRPAAQMGHIEDVDPVSDDQFDDCLAEHVTGDGDRHRADAGDLTHFATDRLAAAQRLHIHPQQCQIARIDRLLGPHSTLRRAGSAASGEDPRLTCRA